MYDELKFINQYNCLQCGEKEIQGIIDTAWNSVYLAKKTLYEIAFKKRTFFERLITSDTSSKIAGSVCLLIQAALVLNLSVMFSYYIAILILLYSYNTSVNFYR